MSTGTFAQEAVSGMKRGDKAHEQDKPLDDQGAPSHTSPLENVPFEPLLEAKDIARLLGVKESWVKDQVRSRVPKEEQIPHIKLGRGKGSYLRFRPSRVNVWLDAKEDGFRCLAK